MQKILFLYVAMASLWSGAASDGQETLYGGRPASYWLARMNSDEKDIRAEALQAFTSGTFPNEVAVPVLVNGLGDKESDLQTRAMEKLVSMGSAALPYLIHTLDHSSGEPELRERVAWTLGKMGPAASSAVDSLAKALRDKASSAIRAAAARALGWVGQDARKAVGSLREALEEDDDTNVHVAVIETLGKIGTDARIAHDALGDVVDRGCIRERRASAEALGSIGPAAKPEAQRLRMSLRDSDRLLRIKAALALWKIEGKAEEPVDVLKQSLCESEAIRIEAIRDLGDIGPDAGAAVAELSKSLGDSNGDIVLTTAIALRKVGPKASEAVPSLTNALTHRSEQVRIALVDALAAIGPEASSAVPELGKVLVHDGDKRVRQSAAHALRVIGAKSVGVVTELTQALQDGDPQVRSEVAWTLQGFGPGAAPAFEKLLEAQTDGDFMIRYNSMLAISNIGLPAVPPLQTVIANTASDERIRIGAIQALGQMGSQAAAGVPTLIEALSDTSREVRIAAGYALGRVVGGINDTSYWWPLKSALDQLENIESEVKPEDQARFERDAKQPVVRVEQDLLNVLMKRWLTYAVTIVVPLLFLSSGLLISGRARRWMLVKLGQRWNFEVGRCDHIIVINFLPDEQKLRMAVDDKGDGFYCLTDAGWPPDSGAFQHLRRRVRGKKVRVEVVESQFHIPWANAIGGPLTTGLDAAVAGQICLKNELLDVERPMPKKVVFAGLGCEEVPYCELVSLRLDKNELEWASKWFRLKERLGRIHQPISEIDLIMERFSLWGASILPLSHEARVQARIEHFQHALCEADFVHVAAHASSEGVFLHDRFMGEADLHGLLDKVRCRVLVLSACDIGDLRGPRSFVFPLVRSGVSILAATKPLRGRACITFFRAFYATLLPERKAVNVELTQGIRQGVAACFPPRGSDIRNWLWREGIDSFILYGDPSLQLQLK
jgi:HEAT repeat protein